MAMAQFFGPKKYMAQLVDFGSLYHPLFVSMCQLPTTTTSQVLVLIVKCDRWASESILDYTICLLAHSAG